MSIYDLRLNFGKLDNIRHLYDYLYQDATIYLNRKRLKIQKSFSKEIDVFKSNQTSLI